MLSSSYAPTVTARSTLGVDALITQATAHHESYVLRHSFSPLFPETCPWDSVAGVPEKAADRLQHQLSAVTAAVLDFRASLTSTAGELAAWLDASDDDVRELAQKFAKLDLAGMPDLSAIPHLDQLLSVPCENEFPGLFKLLTQPGLPQSPTLKKLIWAEMLLGAPVPGDHVATQLARLADVRFWRRAIRVRLLREREHFFLRLRLVGKAAEAYVSDVQLINRLGQLKRQAQWMRDTVLMPRYLEPGKKLKKILTLEDVASSPRTRFAKMYTFVNAMDAISIKEGLATGMLTLTLEPEWHPNPSHGSNSWNGASPRDAHQSMATRWQSILRDLDRLGVGISGLRVVEPHKDGCPHWHLWLLYRPAAEQSILETVMRYFPNKLKIRNSRTKSSKKAVKITAPLFTLASAGDVIFATLDALKARAGRAPTHAKEGAQVELARIDRSISSGASYAMKYMLKTVDGGEQLNKSAGLFPDAELAVTPAQTEKQAKRLAAHEASAKRVDAYRSLWGINAGELFGVAKCLTAWDELRSLGTPPHHPLLKKLWVLARGGEKKGRIAANSGVRGDAKGFIEALGGLGACSKATKGGKSISIGRLTTEALNGYGETIKRTIGVTLVERSRVKVQTGTRIDKSTGEIKPVMAWRSVKTVLAEVRTRVKEWVLVPAKSIEVAVKLLEQRTHALYHDSTPAGLGVLAVRAFWSNIWEALSPERAVPDLEPPMSWRLAVL
jgi:hypothetical protein